MTGWGRLLGFSTQPVVIAAAVTKPIRPLVMPWLDHGIHAVPFPLDRP